jgi:hypothetical protein
MTNDDNLKKEVMEIIVRQISYQLNARLNDVFSSTDSSENIAKKYFEQKNKEFLNELKNGLEISDDIPLEKEAAQITQFLVNIIKRVALETRDDRRKHLTTITKSSYKLSKYLHLDKQLMFLDMLDSISDTEISFLLSYYNKNNDFDISKVDEDQFTMQEKLASVGLIGKEIKNMQNAFRILAIQTKNNFEKMVKEINKIRNQTESYYDLSYEERFNINRDSPVVVYTQTMLGLEFVSFILGDDSVFIDLNEKRMKQVKENISNAVMKFKR